MPEAKNNPIFQHDAKTEEFKRPNAPEFMTSDELRKMQFSGVRDNRMSQASEFWILGEVKATVSHAIAKIDPGIMVRTHMEVFAMGGEGEQ